MIYKNLRELAEKATPGKWQYIFLDNFGGISAYIDGYDKELDDVDREFIAAANPKAILELLDRIKCLEMHADMLEKLIKAQFEVDKNFDNLLKRLEGGEG